MESRPHPDHLFNRTVNLTDVENVQHAYKPTAVLLVSCFSDSVTVVKKESHDYVQFVSDNYSEPVHLSKPRWADLIDTSGSILVFHHKVCQRHLFSLLYLAAGSHLSFTMRLSICYFGSLTNVVCKH